MLRRLALLGFVLVLAAALAPAALAARVHMRVEGKTTTIYGAPDPFVAPAANPLEALEDASVLGEFYYQLTHSSFGDYVSQIGKYPAAGSAGWVFKVNGLSPPVGADKVTLEDGDAVLFGRAEYRFVVRKSGDKR